MSAESKPTLDDEDSVSLREVLEDQEEESRMQEDASAVLGGSDDQECTYAKGYVKRQAVYACSTCPTTEPAGICLACSYQCHEGHNLYELYTKRHFRCDCGNSKFKDASCKLVPMKAAVNEENQYNQNFKGAYCSCARPYPDPEDEIPDDMIQCVVCEDWYHGRHLGTEVPENDSYHEMVCAGCMAKHPFLWAYQVSSSAERVKKELEGKEEETIDVGGGGGATKAEPMQLAEQQTAATSETPPEPGVKQEEEVAGQGASELVSDPRKRKLDDSASEQSATDTSAASDSQSPPKRARVDEEGGGCSEREGGCLLQDLQRRSVVVKNCAAFWQEGWRGKLCSCPACLAMYQGQGVAFLVDVEDTVSAYEEKGRNSTHDPISIMDQEQSLLSGMSHTQKIEMISGFNDMKDQLSGFLKGFAESGKVVSSDDIKEFFSHMDKRRKERLAATAGMQYFCK